MADECRYYYYDSGYSCMLKREKEGSSSIDSDTVHRYCWGYHYEECPRYKAGTSSGGCFLTSACTEAKGLADDCYELTMLRAFRDEYLVKQKSGKAEGNRAEIWEKVYRELVLPCIKLIESSDRAGAHALYRRYVLALEERYLHA